MNDAVIYLTKSDLEKIESEGVLKIRVMRTVEKGQFLRLELDDEKDDWVPDIGTKFE